MTLPLKCQCGEFRGEIENFESAIGRRVVCYCDDCQAGAHALGRAKDVLDEWGGSDIVPVMPSKFKITNGSFGLLRLTEDGLYRWYASCCQSPIANSPNATLPYLGMLTSITDLTLQARDEKLGPIYSRLQCRSAIGTPPSPRSKTIALRDILPVIRFLSRAFFKGAAKPTPFFNEQGQPKATARILSPQERAHLRQFCGPNPTANTTAAK